MHFIQSKTPHLILTDNEHVRRQMAISLEFNACIEILENKNSITNLFLTPNKIVTEDIQ